MKEKGESLLIKETVFKLLYLARLDNRKAIDDEIIMDIENNPDGNGMAMELLRHVHTANAKVRDAVVTGLIAAQITDEKVLKKSLHEMEIIATTDYEKFPAGRAALFLSKYKSHREYSKQIEEALEDFKNLVRAEGWREELEENIPQLKLILKD